jgi:hypothetical protein
MRRDNEKWQNPESVHYNFSGNKLQISVSDIQRQTIVSGSYTAALKTCEVDVAIGWPDIVTTNSYALRLRRDRLLMVNGPDLPDGWNETTNLAISDMTGGYSVFELSGKNAFEILKRGTEISTNNTSPSVSRLFSGFEIFLYRWQQQDCFRLHVSTNHAQAFMQLLQTISNQVCHYANLNSD